MPQKRKSSAPAKKASAPKKKPAAKTAKSTAVQKQTSDPSSVINQLIPYILGFAALFLAVCFIKPTLMGLVGAGIQTLFFGLFSGGAVAVPFFILICALFWKRDIAERSMRYRVIFSGVCLLFISVLVFVFTRKNDLYSAQDFWNNGQSFIGGGVIGGSLGWVLIKAVGSVGSVIISIAMLVIFGLFLVGLTPHSVWIFCAYHVRELSEKIKLRREAAPKVRTAYQKPRREEVPAQREIGRAHV